MSLALRTHSNGNNTAPQRYVARDPFALARDLFAWDFGVRPSAFSPTFEVKETTEAFVVTADVPGVGESNLDIAVHNSVLTISGSRTAEDRKEDEAYALYERQYGSFTRSFSLPDTADGERVEAKLENGVLRLTIAKKAEAKPRKIAVKR
jgi:HSP20 family protein|nr:Hsp20/alpha crystallin family protein [Kofleriaceae bacterium]